MYVAQALWRGMACVLLATQEEHQKIPSFYLNSTQFKTYKLFISGTSFSISRQQFIAVTDRRT